MMEDDIDVTKAVILNHIVTILYVRKRSAGEGLMEEEAEVCIEHFSPYIEWREVAIECEFQALTGLKLVKRYGLMKPKVTSPWEGADGLRLLKPHPSFQRRCQ